jgi:hypothetical protein
MNTGKLPNWNEVLDAIDSYIAKTEYSYDPKFMATLRGYMDQHLTRDKDIDMSISELGCLLIVEEELPEMPKKTQEYLCPNPLMSLNKQIYTHKLMQFMRFN